MICEHVNDQILLGLALSQFKQSESPIVSVIQDPVPELIHSIFNPTDPQSGIQVQTPFSLHRISNQAPFLTYSDDTPDFPLSLTHTHDLTILACSRNARSIGVDAERIQRKVPEGLLNRMLSHAEKEEKEVLTLPPIQLWTIKEASLKWAGTGLRTPMNTLTIRSRITEPSPGTKPAKDKGAAHLDSIQKASNLNSNENHDRFIIYFNDERRVEVVSFPLLEYWVSLAYDIGPQA